MFELNLIIADGFAGADLLQLFLNIFGEIFCFLKPR